MNDVRKALDKLRDLGWTSAAIADELGVSPVTVFRWQKNDSQPDHMKSVLHLLETLATRKRIPRRRRRGGSATYRNLSNISRQKPD